jgi:hypothetical protein
MLFLNNGKKIVKMRFLSTKNSRICDLILQRQKKAFILMLEGFFVKYLAILTLFNNT